jgi:hypothetical protein
MDITKTGSERVEQVGPDAVDITYQDFTVVCGGETRVVRAMKGSTEADGTVRYYLGPQFRAVVGRSGKKAHRTGITVEVKADGRIIQFNTVVLNRQATVTGLWQAAYDAPQGYGSKHNGTFQGRA